MALTIKITPELRWENTSVLDLSTPVDSKTYKLGGPFAWTDGGGANQVDKLWHDQRTLTASSAEDLDLAGALVDAYGTTLTFTTVKLIAVYAAAANTNNVVVGGAAANTFVGPFSDATDQVEVPPGGCFLVTHPAAAGWTVTAGTGDILEVTNSAGGTSVTYDIVIAGD